MADFRTPDISPLASGVRPIEPAPSKAPAMAVAAIGNTVNAGLGLLAGGLEDRKEKRQNQILADFTRRINLINQRGEVEGNLDWAQTQNRSLYDSFLSNYPQLQDELSEIAGNFLDLKPKKTDLEIATDAYNQKVLERALTMGWNPNLPEEKSQKLVNIAREQLASEQAAEARLAQISLQEAEAGLSKTQRQEEIRQTASPVLQAMQKSLLARVESVTQQLSDGEIDVPAAVQTLDAERETLRRFAEASIGIDGGDQLKAVLESLDKSIEFYQDALDGTPEELEYAKRQFELAQTATNAAIYNSDVNVRLMTAADSLFPSLSKHISGELANSTFMKFINRVYNEEGNLTDFGSQILQDSLPILSHNSKADAKPSNLFGDSNEEQKKSGAYIIALHSAIKQGGPPAGSKLSPEKYAQDVNNQLVKMVESIDVYQSAIDNPQEMENIVKLLSSPEFLKWRKENPSEELADALSNARGIVRDNYEVFATRAAGSRIGKMVFNDEGAGFNDVYEIVWENNNVRFKPKPGVQIDSLRKDVKNLRQVEKALRRVINLTANIANTPGDAQQEFERFYLPTLLDNIRKPTSNAPGATVNENSTFFKAISKHEGPEWNTLWNHSHRPGNPFSNFDVTKKTIGELKTFTAPGGPYWKYVEMTNDGTASTPLGKYQIVGSTLREFSQKLGLSDDTLFTPEVQTKIAKAILQNDLDIAKENGKGMEEYGKQVKNRWPGLEALSDMEAAQAAVEFLESSYDILDQSPIPRQRGEAVRGLPVDDGSEPAGATQTSTGEPVEVPEGDIPMETLANSEAPQSAPTPTSRPGSEEEAPKATVMNPEGGIEAAGIDLSAALNAAFGWDEGPRFDEEGNPIPVPRPEPEMVDMTERSVMDRITGARKRNAQYDEEGNIMPTPRPSTSSEESGVPTPIPRPEVTARAIEETIPTPTPRPSVMQRPDWDQRNRASADQLARETVVSVLDNGDPKVSVMLDNWLNENVADLSELGVMHLWKFLDYALTKDTVLTASDLNAKEQQLLRDVVVENFRKGKDHITYEDFGVAGNDTIQNENPAGTFIRGLNDPMYRLVLLIGMAKIGEDEGGIYIEDRWDLHPDGIKDFVEAGKKNDWEKMGNILSKLSPTRQAEMLAAYHARNSKAKKWKIYVDPKDGSDSKPSVGDRRRGRK